MGSYNDSTLGIGRYVAGKSPWERHTNGDELLLVTDGYVDIEVLEGDGSSNQIRIDEGSLFVVPKGKWHQITAPTMPTSYTRAPARTGLSELGIILLAGRGSSREGLSDRRGLAGTVEARTLLGASAPRLHGAAVRRS